MIFADHGVMPKDELVALTTLYPSRSGTGNLWGRLTETVRVFIFPAVKGFRKARLAFMDKSSVSFTTICELDEGSEGWTGMIGLGWVRVKLDPPWRKQKTWSLYFSPLAQRIEPC